jgi:rhamnopyranosyl-N-acetylglucosaminyl-diphospho-decaprenol beta-1,3/1,4-galactofuranosyltransferase
MVVSVVIVTYNRKQLLTRCIEAVLNQTVVIDKIYIVDNASTDGTAAFLEKNGLKSSAPSSATKIVNSTVIHYLRLKENTGGAGGFYTGMQRAHKDSADFLWVMDDDGFPHNTCLEKLLEHTSRYEFIMPISISIENTNLLSWLIRGKKDKFTRSYSELKEAYPDGIMRHAIPFNGLLLPSSLTERVGFPKKEMFIWGDDYEYQYRCMDIGVKPVTILNAIFFHPENKATCYRIFFGLVPVVYSESKLHFTCLIRNSTYNYWHYKGKYIILIKFFIYSWLFIVKKRFALREYKHYLQCVMDGIKGNFTRHLGYIKK